MLPDWQPRGSSVVHEVVGVVPSNVSRAIGGFVPLVLSSKSLEFSDGVSGARAEVTRDVLLT